MKINNSNSGEYFMQLEESEQLTLGGILLDSEQIILVKRVLAPKDFRYEKHQLIYRALLDMFEQSLPIDVYTFWCFLDEHDQLDSVGRGSYLTYLCEVAGRS